MRPLLVTASPQMDVRMRAFRAFECMKGFHYAIFKGSKQMRLFVYIRVIVLFSSIRVTCFVLTIR